MSMNTNHACGGIGLTNTCTNNTNVKEYRHEMPTVIYGMNNNIILLPHIVIIYGKVIHIVMLIYAWFLAELLIEGGHVLHRIFVKV